MDISLMQDLARVLTGRMRTQIDTDGSYVYKAMNRNPNAALTDTTWIVCRIDENGNTIHPKQADGLRYSDPRFAADDMPNLSW